MFTSTAQKIAFAVIIILIIAIPSGSFLLAQRLNFKTKAAFTPIPTPVTRAKEVPKDGIDTLKDSTTAKPGGSSEPQIQISYGPTLKFTLNIEGRPKTNQSAKAFLGIAAGNPQNAPTYLLSFSVDVPSSGQFSNVSLTGLTIGNTYTAYLKTPSQIATASAFIVKPLVTDLGTLNLVSGDLNEDNIISNADYNIASASAFLKPSHAKWNPLADLNMDNVINNFDLGIILKNIGKTGGSGVWYSTPKVASASASITTPTSIGSPTLPETNQIMRIENESGTWVFIPKE